MRTFLAAALALSLCGASIGLAQDSGDEPSLEGRWLVQKQDAVVLIEPSGSELVGKLVWVKDRDGIKGTERLDLKNPEPDLRSRHVLGMVILTGLPLEPDEGGVYRGGRIYNPKTGRHMPIRVQLEAPGLLRVRVGNEFLHQTTHWTRVDADSQSTDE